jgi:Flp pilus assembly pilin Flp
MSLASFIRRTARNQSGAAAVEFALVAVPFCLLLFAILDAAMIFFVSGMLSNAVDLSVRQVRLGVANQSGWTAADFKKQICSRIPVNTDCANSLVVIVQPVSSFSPPPGQQLVKNGVLQVNSSYALGGAASYMIVQAFLPWSSLMSAVTPQSMRLSGGKILLSASALFKNEPFD